MPLGVIALPSAARAYRTLGDDLSLSSNAAPTHDRIEVVLSADVPSGVALEDLRVALEHALAAWTVDCSSVRFDLLPESGGPANDGDGRTTIATIHSGWVGRGYGASQAAITEIRVVDRPSGWMITDADVLLNGETIDWASSDAPDLASVLVHELGHVLGLAHPCEHDVRGSTAPACESMPDAAAASVMFPHYQPGAHELRVDDRNGVCALRPACPSVECPAGASCHDGACVFSCVPGDLCEGGTCGVGAGVEGTCVPLGTEGASCARGEDCSSRLCLTSMDLGSFCTRACRGGTECAGDQRCVAVDGVSVCAPRGRGASCAVGSGATASGTQWLALALAALAAAWRLRRGSKAACQPGERR